MTEDTKSQNPKSKLIWNNESSLRQDESDKAIWDGSIETCKFRFFCGHCKLQVVMEDAYLSEDDDGILRTRCKCPICHRWKWI